MSTVRAPYFRLSSFYFFYFASLGAFLPYWGPYLKHLGFSPVQIGELMAVVMATKIVAPNVWGWLADRSGQRAGLIRLTTGLAAAAFASLLFLTTYWWLLAALAVYAFFWNAALPQFEATTLSYLGADVHRYSRIRLWGSIGFIAAVAALPPVLDRFGLQVLPAMVLVLLAGIWLNTLFLDDSPLHGGEPHPLGLGGVLRRRETWTMLAACLLGQASHGAYYTFFSIFLTDRGYASEAVGLLWALGVVAEVMVFLVVHRWLLAVGARCLLVVALMLTVVRWLLIAWLTDVLVVLLFAQVLHAASFGLLHAAAIHLVHGSFPGSLQGRGQALYSSVSFGVGGALGSLGSGYVWAHGGGEGAFVMSAVLAAMGVLVAWWGLCARRGCRESESVTTA